MTAAITERDMKPIPISAAKRIADKYGYDQVIVVGRRTGDTPPHGEHCTTYGVNRVHCNVAAIIGRFFTQELMQWGKRQRGGT